MKKNNKKCINLVTKNSYGAEDSEENSELKEDQYIHKSYNIGQLILPNDRSPEAQSIVGLAILGLRL